MKVGGLGIIKMKIRRVEEKVDGQKFVSEKFLFFHLISPTLITLKLGPKSFKNLSYVSIAVIEL